MSEPGLRLVPAHGGADVDALVGRVARGDAGAFEELYDELSSAVFGLARRVVRDPARAEDVTQEVFLEVWRKAARFDRSLGKAKTWVMTIADRRAVDAVIDEVEPSRFRISPCLAAQADGQAPRHPGHGLGQDVSLHAELHSALTSTRYDRSGDRH